MIRETFNSTEGYLESTWSGHVDLQEIVAYIRRLKENTDYPRKLKILTNALDARIYLSMDELQIISGETKKTLKNYNSIMDAFFVQEAIVAALSTMYMKMSQMKNYGFRIFSSKEAAEHWLSGISS